MVNGGVARMRLMAVIFIVSLCFSCRTKERVVSESDSARVEVYADIEHNYDSVDVRYKVGAWKPWVSPIGDTLTAYVRVDTVDRYKGKREIAYKTLYRTNTVTNTVYKSVTPKRTAWQKIRGGIRDTMAWVGVIMLIVMGWKIYREGMRRNIIK